MKKLDTKETFTTADLATFFNVKTDTAQKWLASGTPRSFRTHGGHFRIHRTDLIKFLIEQKKYVPGLTSPFKSRILIVEDDTHARIVFRRLLRKEFPEVEIHEAVEGYEAGIMTATLLPNVVVLDLILPGLDGVRICRKLRADRKFDDVKILAISGYRTDRIGKLILNAGADRFLGKPIGSEEFVQTVGELLEISSKVEK